MDRRDLKIRFVMRRIDIGMFSVFESSEFLRAGFFVV